MTVTALEAKTLISKAQSKQAYEWAKEHYTENPYRLRNGQTLEQHLAVDYALDDSSDPEWGEGLSGVVEIDGHNVSHIESFGGEGQGDYAYEIYKIDDQLFRKEGFYASYDGTSWDEYDDLHEVEPYTVEITKYKEKK